MNPDLSNWYSSSLSLAVWELLCGNKLRQFGEADAVFQRLIHYLSNRPTYQFRLRAWAVGGSFDSFIIPRSRSAIKTVHVRLAGSSEKEASDEHLVICAHATTCVTPRVLTKGVVTL